MGNFEKLSVVVIVVIIVMILAVAVVEWTNGPSDGQPQGEPVAEKPAIDPVLSSEPPRTDLKAGGKGTVGGGALAKGSKTDGKDLLINWDDPFRDTPMKEEKKGTDPALAGKDQAGKGNGEATPAPTPGPTSADVPETTHVVAEGETLSDISKKHWGKASLWSLIVDANPGLRPEALRKGQTIKIPARKGVIVTPATPGGEVVAGGGSKPVPGKEYVVQSNDTWERISQAAYNTSARWPEIYVKNLNRVSGMKDLSRGKTILIPK